MSKVIDVVALIAAVILPLWNLPLIMRIIQRGSSEDISIYWALGVWTCLALMAPSAFTSTDIVWRTFNIINLTLFSFVVIVVVKYRKKKS
ncbi:MAG: hypothetical protein ABIJ27_01245 [Candidatus Omnitrophota bacterium]